MRMILLVVVCFSGAWYFFSGDASRFVTLPPADGHGINSVYIVAPENCPSDAAQRADGLARDLGTAGINPVRTELVDFGQLRAQAQADSMPQSMIDQALRINNIMTGTLPIVFVRGRAKNNPTLKEVVAEYKRTAR